MRTMPEPVITIPEMKRILSRDGDALEYMVKTSGIRCSYGYNVYLPQTCRPTRNKLLFAYCAGSYLMYLEHDVQYFGADPYLETLCRSGSVRADDWGDLMDFCLMLPEYY